MHWIAPSKNDLVNAGRPARRIQAEKVFRVPAEARWSHLQAKAKQSTIGKIVDDAMVAIERDWKIANAKVRMTNRSRFTSTFDNRQSKFA